VTSSPTIEGSGLPARREVLFVATRNLGPAAAAAVDGGPQRAVAATGAEGIERLEATAPACVVTGDTLPDMSVRTFVERVRERYEDVPIVVVDSTDEVAAAELRAAGATAVLESDTETGQWRRYDTIVNTVRDGIYQFDRDGCFVALNDAVEELTGYDREELLGAHVSTILDEADVSRGEALVEDLIGEQAPGVGTMEMTIQRADGTTLATENRIAPLYVDGTFSGSVGVVRDVSGRKQRESDLQQERDLHEQLLDTSPIGIAVIGADGSIRRTNDRTADILGVPADELTTRMYDDSVWSVTDEAGEEIPTEEYPPSQVFETGEPVYDWVANVQQPDGEQVWVQFNAAPLFGADERVDRVVLTMEDVTDHRERERELRQQAALLGGIFNAVPDIMYTFDAAGNFLRWNDRFTDVTGYADEEIAEMSPLDFIPAEDHDAIRDAITSVIDEQSVRHVESALITKDGREIPFDFSGGPVVEEEGEVIALTGVGHDVSDRVERERQIDHQRSKLQELNRINAVIRDIDQALIDATTRTEAEQSVCDRLAAADAYHGAILGRFDADGRYETSVHAGVDADAVDATAAERTGPAREAMETGEPVVERNSGESAALRSWQGAGHAIESLVAIPITYGETTAGVLQVLADRSSAFGERERTVLTELGETLGHAITSIERKKRERILTALQDSTRELINAETKAEVSERVVAATDDVLDAAVGIFLFDPDAGGLTVGAATRAFEAHYDDWTPDLTERESVAWTAFLDDRTIVVDDFRTTDTAADGLDDGSGLFAPLGEHGVFVALSTERAAFGPDMRRVLDLFAATAEATLDRVEGEQELREQDRTLKERNRQLTHLKRINGIIRELDQSIIRASTRDEIERAVCDHLAGHDGFEFVWIGTQDWAGETVTPRTWAGDDHGYLDTVSLSMADSNPLPAAQTLRQHTPTHVSDTAADLRTGHWRKEALKRDFRAVVSVPLVYGDVVYGALTVYTTDPTALDEMSRTVLEELGETLGYAINAIKAREDLLTERAVELELEVEDDGVFGRLAAGADCRIDITELVPGTKDTTTVFFTTDVSDPEVVMTQAASLVAIDGVTLLAEGDTRTRFRAQVSGDTLPHALVEWGARPRTIEIDAQGSRVVVGLGSESDVRPFVEKLDARFPGVKLLARRDNHSSELTSDGLISELETRLTDRQLEVLKTAFMSGFFESPKEQTGREIAASLDITQPTFNHHLRVAQRKLFEIVLGER
jgi:PAS domain S-box-containing protein